MFDLNLIPIARQNGQDSPSIEGLYTAQPPRRAARGREADRLVLYLTMAGSAPLPSDQMQKLLQNLAETYFKTSGAVTAAMRGVAEALNTFILDRNLRSSNTGRQSAGWLTQVVARGETLSLGHSGPVHAYVTGGGQEVHHYFDPQSGGRGLGLSRQVGIRYFQTNLQAGAMLVLSHQPAAEWQVESMAAASQTPDALRRLLAAAPDPDLNAILVVPQPGSGKITVFRARTAPAAVDMAQPASPAPVKAAQPLPAARPVESKPAQSLTPPVELAAQLSEPVSTAVALDQPSAHTADEPAESAPQVAAVVGQDAIQPQRITPSPRSAISAAPASKDHRPQTSPRRSPAVKAQPKTGAPIKQAGAGVLRAGQAFSAAASTAFQQAGKALHTLLRRILPDATILDLPPSTLLFIAIAIPILISVIAAVVYLERGKGLQHQAYLEQAITAAEEGRASTDPTIQRAAWNEVLAQIELAEKYRMSNESQQLRLQAYTILDDLDQIDRLEFQPAIIGGLSASIRVVRMATSGTDLYMLDGTTGQVLRAILSGGGYQLDNTFACGPLSGPVYVGPLIDMTVMPRASGQDQAGILAVDENGILLTCTPGERPLVQELAPSTTSFGSPRAFDLNNGDLYVLDPDGNAVWIYREMEVAQPPRFFFGDEIPPLQDVIDLVVNGDDLYLLHADGHQTRCTYSWIEGAPTRCEDPLIYTDRRQGRQNGAVIPDAVFNQIQFSPPPDPSLYLLDPANQAIYHFGMNLGFQRQYRAVLPTAGQKATAFTVATSRVAFLALGSAVYYAAIP